MSFQFIWLILHPSTTKQSPGMSKPLILFLFILLSTSARAQDTGFDSLSTRRNFLNTRIYRNEIVLHPSIVLRKYRTSNEAMRKFNTSRIMLPAGLLTAAAGVFVSYDAIKGVPRQAEINGVVYPYKVRNIKQLIIGILGTAAGISLIEYSNDLKVNSVKIYNSTSKKVAFNIKFGISPESNLGLYTNF